MHNVVQKYKTKEKIDEEFIKKWLPYVKWIAERVAVFLPPYIDKEDVISQGILGLIKAAENYTPNKKVDFKTYAFYRIKGAIIDEFRKLDYQSRSSREKFKKFEKAFMELQNKYERMPTEEEIAQKLNISKKKLLKYFEEMRGPYMLSLETEIDEEKEKIIDEEDALEKIEKEELKKKLIEAINKLPERERLLITLYYYEDLTLKEIGKIIGVNEARVCQLHSQVLLYLKNVLKKII